MPKNAPPPEEAPAPDHELILRYKEQFRLHPEMLRWGQDYVEAFDRGSLREALHVLHARAARAALDEHEAVLADEQVSVARVEDPIGDFNGASRQWAEAFAQKSGSFMPISRMDWEALRSEETMGPSPRPEKDVPSPRLNWRLQMAFLS